MPGLGLKGTLAAVAVALGAAWNLTGGDGPAQGADPAGAVSEPAAGELLIASAEIQDPRFFHTVILILRHDRQGAFGIVINRPVAERLIAQLLDDAGGSAQGGSPTGKGDVGSPIEGTVRVFAGGPVQPQLGFVVHSTDYRRAETMAVDTTLAMTASKEILRDIGQHKGPAKALFALGYAGWGEGQLENEIARHDWFTAPDDAELVFDEDRATLGSHALARRMREL
ncbi:MAG: YqgE/AlgH family protein [Alphaproteobacteria bacterium]|nr:YqgE/AlgH family protein [Alphaproteobacteria bacterium]